MVKVWYDGDVNEIKNIMEGIIMQGSLILRMAQKLALAYMTFPKLRNAPDYDEKLTSLERIIRSELGLEE